MGGNVQLKSVTSSNCMSKILDRKDLVIRYIIALLFIQD